MKNILCVLLLAAGFGLGAHATPLDDKIKTFDDALKAASPASSANPMFAERLGQQFNSWNMPGGEANLEAAVQQVLATNHSKAVQASGKALLAELQAEKKERLDKLTAKIDDALTPVPAAVAKAEKPADLDTILDNLLRITPVNGGGYGYDPDMQAQNARITAAYQFVAQWQDYLSYLQNGNNQQALNSLRNLLNTRPGGEPIVPRSEILARISPLEAKTAPGVYVPPPRPDIEPILDHIKTLDDLGPAVQQVGAINGQDFNATQLGQFAFLYGQAKNGVEVSLDLTPQFSNGTPSPGFARIESMLLLYLLPRFLGSDAPAPNANETVDAYLQRVTTEAEKAQNWPLLQRVINAQLKIARVQGTLQGSQNFLAGLNQEMAGQYAMAVSDYQNALRTPDNFISPSFIGDRLAALKKDHAADYEEGMKSFLHPAPPIYPPGFNPYARFGMPGYPIVAPAVVPAATPAPAAAPAQPTQTNAPAAKK